MKQKLIEWIQLNPDKEEYIGLVDSERLFFISMVGYTYKCNSLPSIPVRKNFVDMDKNLDKLKNRTQIEFNKELADLNINNSKV